MTRVEIEVVGFVEEHQPNFVESRIRDAWGREWKFIDKCAISVDAYLEAGSDYPLPGVIACRIISRKNDTQGREVVSVETTSPWSVEAVGGQTQFDVLPHQLSDLPNC